MKETKRGGMWPFTSNVNPNLEKMQDPPKDDDTTVESAYTAIMNNDLDSLKGLNIKNGHMVFFKHGEETAVGLATKKQNVEMVKYLFDKGAIPADTSPADAMSVALDNKSDIEMIEVILNALTGELSMIQKQNIAEDEPDQSEWKGKIYFDKIKYNDTRDKIINSYFYKASAVMGRMDITELFLNKGLISFADENVLKKLLLTILEQLRRYDYNTNMYEERNDPDDIDNRGSREDLYKMLEYILQQGGSKVVAMESDVTADGWNYATNSYSTKIPYKWQEIISAIADSEDPRVLGIFVRNDFKLDDIIDYTEQYRELNIREKPVRERIEKMSKSLSQSNRKAVPEVTRTMRKQLGDQVDPALSRVIGQFLGGRRTRKFKNTNKKKKKIKKRVTRKR